MKNDATSLAHTTWNCKYHIVFAPKYRRKVFYGEKRLEIGAILRSLCEWKEVEIVGRSLIKTYANNTFLLYGLNRCRPRNFFSKG